MLVWATWTQILMELTCHQSGCHLCSFHGLLCFRVTAATGRCECLHPGAPALASGVRGPSLGCFAGWLGHSSHHWAGPTKDNNNCTRQSLPRPLWAVSAPLLSCSLSCSASYDQGVPASNETPFLHCWNFCLFGPLPRVSEEFPPIQSATESGG